MTGPTHLIVSTRIGMAWGGRVPEQERVHRWIDLAARELIPRLGRETQPLVLVLLTDTHNLPLVRDSVISGYLSLPLPHRVVVITTQRSEADDSSVLSDMFHASDRILWIRCDVDDFFLPGVLTKAVARASSLDCGTLIDFPRGYKRDTLNDRIERSTFLIQGPMFGIVTDGLNPLPTPGDHTQAHIGRYRVTSNSRSWVQTVHGTNQVTVMNSASRSVRFRTLCKSLRTFQTERGLFLRLAAFMDLIPVLSFERSRIEIQESSS